MYIKINIYLNTTTNSIFVKLIKERGTFWSMFIILSVHIKAFVYNDVSVHLCVLRYSCYAKCKAALVCAYMCVCVRVVSVSLSVCVNMRE